MYRESGAFQMPAPMPPVPKKDDGRPPFVEFGAAGKFNAKIIRPWHEIKPAIGEFDDIYAQWNLKRDKDYVRETKKKFAGRKYDKAVIAEYAMLQGFGDEMWIPDVSVMPTSEFDDIARGVNFVVTFENDDPEKSQHLGVDVTTGDLSIYFKKMQRVESEIKRGQLRKLKYFEADDPAAGRGEIEVPVVVLKVDSFQLKNIMDAMVKNPKDRTKEERKLLTDLSISTISEISKQIKEGIRLIKKILPKNSSRRAKMLSAYETLNDLIIGI